MNILITGGNSFIAKSIVPLLDLDVYNVYSFDRDSLDITCFDDLNDFFDNNIVDVIIHTATKGGRRIQQDLAQDFYDNLLMLENLLYFKDRYKQLFIFSSGAEYNRNFNIEGFSEYNDQIIPPKDYYGLSKYIQTQIIKNLDISVINLRLFNVFGPLETEDRFIKTSIKNYINKQPIKVWEDKLFSFFYIDDLYCIIKYFLDNPTNRYEEINCVYKKSIKLSETAAIINNLSNYRVPIIIDKISGKNYCGTTEDPLFKNYSFFGLEYGIKQVYEYIKNTNI